MRFLLPFSMWILSLARPDFESAIPFFELDENTRTSGAYRHRAKKIEERLNGRREGSITTPTHSNRRIPLFGSISEPLARSEGWVGGKGMKKIMIVKDKKKVNEKAQGINIHPLPKGAKAVSLPSADKEIQSISDLRRKFNVSLNTGESILPPITDSTESTEWPPMRSTLPPKGGEFNKQTFLLLSGWLNSEKGKKRSQRKEDEEWNERRRIPMIRALARSRPIVRIDDIAEAPNGISSIVSITTTSPISTTQRISRRHRKRMKKPFQKIFKEFSSMSFSPMEEKISVTTVIPPSRNIETTEFVENLAESIEKEESEVVSKRREHRKRNYGLNPLMYKVVDGVLYDRAGQPVRRVDIPFRDEPRKPKSFLGPAKNIDDQEIEHDEISIRSTNHIFYEPTTPFSPHTPSFDIDSSSLSLDPLPLPTAAMVSFPQSTTQFHWGSPLATTPLSIMRDGKIPPPFPFVNCYMNNDGFMCCNRTLESILRSSYESLPCRKGRNGCSVQHIVKRVRNEVEKRFGTSFEVLSSLGDFAMHAHFASDLTCKIEKEGRFIAAYATPKSTDSSFSQVTDYMMIPRDRSLSNPKELQIKNRKKIISNQAIPPPSPLPAERFNGGFAQTPEQSLEFLHSSTLTTTIPNISVNLGEQLDSPSVDVTKPDDNFHRAVPFHERSRGKNDFSFQ
ncbi:hypothetical protein PRIPAC_79432 [Pristionchus pacificus]|nr:hypothetical protein PRIPAC_79432 [Pristionchus pacificus]